MATKKRTKKGDAAAAAATPETAARRAALLELWRTGGIAALDGVGAKIRAALPGATAAKNVTAPVEIAGRGLTLSQLAVELARAGAEDVAALINDATRRHRRLTGTAVYTSLALAELEEVENGDEALRRAGGRAQEVQESAD